MKYAWANPTTGIREQAPTIEEARYRVWNELQEMKRPPQFVEIHEQVAAGSVSRSGSSVSDGFRENNNEWWEDLWAWADPINAAREIRTSLHAAIRTIQERLSKIPDSATSEVVLYRTRPVERIMTKGTPAPPAPSATPGGLDTPKSLISKIHSGERSDYDQIQTLALLWIAQGVQQLVAGDAPQQVFAKAFAESLNALEPVKDYRETDEEHRARMVQERYVTPPEPRNVARHEFDLDPDFISPQRCRVCGAKREHEIHQHPGEAHPFTGTGEICRVCQGHRRAALHQAWEAARDRTANTPHEFVAGFNGVCATCGQQQVEHPPFNMELADPREPHNYIPSNQHPGFCAFCMETEKHAIHGYTGE